MTNSPLSDREQEILNLVATGASNKQISQTLQISVNTVKVHLRNIYTKLEVASRTEAAMWAVQNGLVETLDPGQEDWSVRGDTKSSLLERLPDRYRPIFVVAVASVFVVIGFLVSQLFLSERRSQQAGQVPVEPGFEQAQWKPLSEMPTARNGMASAAYDNHIYAIAGEGKEGVLSVNERYDPLTDTWETLKPKPVPVTEVHAGVIGGEIYIPGGKMSDGNVANLLEIYDPRTDSWRNGKSLPFRLSAYALAEFEGKLYLFGGWDGLNYLNSVIMYDPEEDSWAVKSPMPTARAFAGASEAGGKIFVIGGFDGGMTLNVNESYSPVLDHDGESAWDSKSPMPENKSGLGVINVTDSLIVLGGDPASEYASYYRYLPQQDQWEQIDVIDIGEKFGFAMLESRVHIFGGIYGEDISQQHKVLPFTYSALFPIIR